jgi:hypothetical protein
MHTIVDKGGIKILKRFTQIEMKEHNHGEENIKEIKMRAT